jgi:hypothetical protein
MRIAVIILLLLAAHFCLSAFAPSPAGKGIFYWPWATDSKPVLAGVGRLPAKGGSILTAALAGIAGLCFLGAVLCLFGVVVPAGWWMPLVLVGVAGSIALFLLYFTPLSLLPILLDLVLIWGVFFLNWTVAALNGS